MLEVLVGFFKTIHVKLEVNCSLAFLQDFECADVNFFHQAQLLLLIQNELIVHVHEDLSAVKKFSIQDAFAVQESSESNKLLLSLELKLNDGFLAFTIVIRSLGACGRAHF